MVGTLATLHRISDKEDLNNVYGIMDLSKGPWWVSLISGLIALAVTSFEVVVLFYGQLKLTKRRKSHAFPNRYELR
ncbi:MAG: hypothetical protein BWY98_00887 [Tenericutes bacterium ADurb.BinA155]|nr:MAG: hypothetical protein BWY98_00887 [Tenericutes bacterium ADurb.BinA155]